MFYCLQDYALNIYFRQEWRDTRLIYNKNDVGGLEKLKLEDSILERLWTPDTFFRNEKGASFHEVTVPNRLLRLNATGWLWYVTK